MGQVNRQKKDERKRIRARFVTEISKTTVGVPLPKDENGCPLEPGTFQDKTLLIVDDFGDLHFLGTNPKGTGWVQITNRAIPEWTKEDQEEFNKWLAEQKEKAMAEAQAKRDEQLAREQGEEQEPGIITGGQAIDLANALPPHPGEKA